MVSIYLYIDTITPIYMDHNNIFSPYSINSDILEVTQVTNLVNNALPVTSCNLQLFNRLIINKKL